MNAKAIISTLMIALLFTSCGIRGDLKRPSEIKKEQEAKEKKAREE